MSSKVFIGIVVALLVVIGGLFVFSQSDDATNEFTTNETSEAIQDMSLIPTDLPAAVAKAIERQSEPNVYVIDVRTQEEWEAGHATDALQWGLADKITQGDLPPVPKDAEIYIYCRSGARAGQAIRIMQEAGYTNMTNIRGFSDWQAAGGPAETGA